MQLGTDQHCDEFVCARKVVVMSREREEMSFSLE